MNPSEEEARFACEQLASGCDTMVKMLHGLLDSKGRVAEEIHGLRKAGKSLRGGFSLLGLEKTSVKEIQAIGRLLSGPRDAVSRYNTWQKLGWEGDAATTSAIGGLLEQQTHSAARRPPPEAVAWCVARVSAARASLLKIPADDLPDLIPKGLKKLTQRVAKRCKKLDRHGEEDFHDARKALKALLGAIAFMPEESFAPSPLMKELADTLGDENDLATLAAWLDEHGFTADFAPSLWKKLESSRKHLRKLAIKDGRHLVRPKAALKQKAAPVESPEPAESSEKPVSKE